MQKRWKTIGIIAGVCLAIGAVVLSRTAGKTVPEHIPGDTEIQEHTTVQTEQMVTQTYDSSFFVSLVQDTCGGVLPLTNLAVGIQEDEKIVISGILSKEQATKLLDQQSDSIAQSYAAVLEFLPEELPVSCELRLQANDGTVNLTLQKLSVASMELPSAWMQQDLMEPLEQNFRTELEKTFTSISAISSQDGILHISGERK